MSLFSLSRDNTASEITIGKEQDEEGFTDIFLLHTKNTGMLMSVFGIHFICFRITSFSVSMDIFQTVDHVNATDCT